MRAILTTFVLGLLVLSVLPAVLAVSVGGGVTPDIETEDFEPMVWLCDSRVVLDDNTEPGRACFETPCDSEEYDCHDGLKRICLWEQDVSSYHLEGIKLIERLNNYAFEGEQIVWDVLVMDKNGIEKISDVFVTVGSTQGSGNDIEANCI